MDTSREIYEKLSSVFVDKGIGSNNFSLLEKLYHLASDNEKLQPEWRKLQQKTIDEQISKEHDTIFMKDDLFKLVLLILDNRVEVNINDIRDMAGRLANIYGVY